MKKAGRPPKAPEDRMTQRIYVPATPKEVEMFDEQAAQRDISRQAMARAVIGKWMGWDK